MDIYGHITVIFIFLSTILCVHGWQCETLECIIYPQSLKLWRHLIEVSSRSFTVKFGSPFSITCDGSCVGSHADPYLRWYGPDKHWISYEGRGNRIYVEKSFSRRFQKLHFREVSDSDEGLYICRGWLGEKHGWDTKSFKLVVESPATAAAVTTKSAITTPYRILSTTRTSRAKQEIMTRQQTTQTTTTTEATSSSTTTESVASRPTTTTDITTQTAESFTNTTEEDCFPPKFKCGSGECFDQRYVCDSYPDCADNSDETLCVSQNCTENMQGCDDGDGCVFKSQICDGIAQCNDRSDEAPDLCNYLHV